MLSTTCLNTYFKSIDMKNTIIVDIKEKFCEQCEYFKSQKYHDVMWCRDCRQKDRFKLKS